jgi:hypothetical protein
MKYLLLSLALLTSAYHISAMNEQAAPATPSLNTASDDELTPDDTNCFEWFEELAQEDPSYFNQLPPEDQEVFNKRLKLQDHPDQVRRSRSSAAHAFLIQEKAKGTDLKYDKDTLTNVLIKVAKKLHAPKSDTVKEPTNILDARTYVWSQLMTDEQRAAWNKDIYNADPRRVERVTIQWSMLLAKKLAEIGLIENTEVSVAIKSQKLFDSKWKLLKKMYEKPPLAQTQK